MSHIARSQHPDINDTHETDLGCRACDDYCPCSSGFFDEDLLDDGFEDVGSVVDTSGRTLVVAGIVAGSVLLGVAAGALVLRTRPEARDVLMSHARSVRDQLEGSAAHLSYEVARMAAHTLS